MTQVTIELGALAKPLSEQIPSGTIDSSDVEVFQKDSDAITRLYVRGYITGAQTATARKKLLRALQKAFTQATRCPPHTKNADRPTE